MSGSDRVQDNAPVVAHEEQHSSHAVGYGKPPAHSRFRPGQSGNPKGRPKGSKGVRGLVNSALDETVRVAENGRPRAIKKRQAILLSMIAKAIKGDVRAAALVMRLMETHDPAPHQPDGQLSHEDWLELLSDDQVDYAIGQLTQSLDDVAVADGIQSDERTRSALERRAPAVSDDAARPEGARPRADAEDRYAVGYAKPPAHSRFKAGRSGNPKGRPKGSRSAKALLDQALSAPVTISEGGTTRIVEQRTALFKSLVAKAIKGDARAAALVVKLMDQFGLGSPADDPLRITVIERRIVRPGDPGTSQARWREEAEAGPAGRDSG